MIPTYECAGYLAEVLESVLNEEVPPAEMQIEVVDDSSGDDPESVLRRVGAGRVGFYRQPSNVGIAANLTSCIRRSRGHLVHVLHGDDAVLPGFYRAYSALFTAYPEAVMAFSRAVAIDEDGRRLGLRGEGFSAARIVDDALESLITENYVVASSAVVRRRAYEELGGFNQTLSHTADWEMWMRVASTGPVGYLHEPYVLYREHVASDSNKAVLEARNIDEYVRATELGIELLPPARRPALRRSARRKYAAVAEYYRRELHSRGQHRAALRHARRALRLNPVGRSPIRFASSVIRNVFG
jgi:glycosyltransferase involved in cell wall biosynthesis